MAEENGQPEGQVSDKVDALAGEIEGLFDGNPLEGAEVSVKEPDAEPPKAEPPKEPEKPPEEPPKQEKKKIKWQGQEKEVSEDELIELAQKGFDYTQKTQTLAERERQLAPLEGLFKQVQTDPALAQHIAGYWQQKQAPAPEPPKSDDPIEQLKREIRAEIKGEIEQELNQKIAPLNHQQVLGRVKQEVMADPLYAEVQGELVKSLQSLPPAIARTVYLQLDQDPQAYLEAFTATKERVVKGKATQTKTESPPPTQATRTERAPILESTGVSLPPDTGAQERQRLSKMKVKALRNGDPDAIAEWLSQSGAINNLL